jgi:diaminopimelate decarboxylase
MKLNYGQILKLKNYLPFYVYDYKIIKGQILKLKKNLPLNVKVFYSVKVNPNITILRIMKNFGTGAEIISEGEFLAARKAGFGPGELLFGGSIRSDSELALLANENIGLISLESLAEIRRLNKLAGILNRKIKVLLRFSPDERSRYGNSFNDLENILSNFSSKFPFLILRGIHEYVQGRVYEPGILIGHLNHFFSQIILLEKKFNLSFEIIDIGGGFGNSEDKEFPLPKFCRKLDHLLEKYSFENRKIILELGRYLVAKSGFYVTKIIECRRPKRINYLIAEGIVNNYYAAMLNKSPQRYWPVDDFKIEILGRSSAGRKLYRTGVCGQMSSAADIIGRDNKSYFFLPEARPDDLLVIKGVGAYGLTWAHSLIGTRSIAAEFILFNNKLELIRDKVEPADLLDYQRIPAFLRKTK